jgi:hypothetical protein
MEELIYAVIFIIMGSIAILWAQDAPPTKGDPFLIKISQYSTGIVCVVIGAYLLFKVIAGIIVSPSY